MADDSSQSVSNTPVSDSGQVCDLCGCETYQVFAKRGRGGVPIQTVICGECGLVYTNPRMTDEENARWYKTNYWGDYKSQQAPDEKFFQRRLPKIREIFAQVKERLPEGAKVLEIGCGVGALLSRISAEVGESGSVTGIEPHAGHAKFAKESKGLDVRNGLLEDILPDLEKGTFDLVVMNHVLEHTTSPTETLLAIKGLLKPGGIYIAEVPNVEAPGSRLSHFFHPAHHYNFSPATFERLALKSGFEVLDVSALDGDLPGTRLNGTFRKPEDGKEQMADGEMPGDDAAARAEALRAYGRWYWLTLASLRKKVTHWQRQRGG